MQKFDDSQRKATNLKRKYTQNYAGDPPILRIPRVISSNLFALIGKLKARQPKDVMFGGKRSELQGKLGKAEVKKTIPFMPTRKMEHKSFCAEYEHIILQRPLVSRGRYSFSDFSV